MQQLFESGQLPECELLDFRAVRQVLFSSCSCLAASQISRQLCDKYLPVLHPSSQICLDCLLVQMERVWCLHLVQTTYVTCLMLIFYAKK